MAIALMAAARDALGGRGGGGARRGSAGPPAAGQEPALLHALLHEVAHSPPGARLSARVRGDLERLPPGERRALVGMQVRGRAALSAAARRGNAEAVEYLALVCGADVEQRGAYERRGAVSRVTPLWEAAAEGRADAVRALLALGARVDADAACDAGCPPLRAACQRGHLHVARLLLAAGADADGVDRDGGTCLMAAVRSVPLCALLLQAGAAVDARDSRLRTALHHAARTDRADAVRLLLDAGADPALCTRDGDDPLRAAALQGAAAAVQALLAAAGPAAPPPVARQADALELLGAVRLQSHHDAAGALAAWRRATRLRHPPGDAPQEPKGAPWGPQLAQEDGAAREWRSAAELEALARSPAALRAQAPLVVMRVLGPWRGDLLARLMLGRLAPAEHRRAFALWVTADGAHTCRLMCLVAEAVLRAEREREPELVFEPLLCTLDMLTMLLPPLAPRLAHAAPPDDAQLARLLPCAVQLVRALLAATSTSTSGDGDGERRAQVAAQVRALVAKEPRCPRTGDSLLHLGVSRLRWALAASPEPAAAAMAVAGALLAAGASAAARNLAGSSALHVACAPGNYSDELARLLLAAGAHLDAPNRFGDSALRLAGLHARCGLRALDHVSLRCLAARALVPVLPPRPRPLPAAVLPLPDHLLDFIDLHRP